MTMKNFLLTGLILLMAAAAFPAALRAQNYWRVINEERYKRMSQFERVQYDKALDLLNRRQYRAAASEFERFLLQYKESDVLPYMVFMHAYALHQAKDRNRAISIYNEVLDFYPGEIEAAAPALYYRGVAQFENGDYTKGMKTMKQLLDDEDYGKEPVAASASLQLVRNHWKNKEPDKAVQYLKQIFSTHRGTEAADKAKNYFMASCLATGAVQEYTNWYLYTYQDEALDKKISPSDFRVNMANALYDLLADRSWQYFSNENLLAYRGGRKGPDPHREMWTYLQDSRRHYEKAGRMWDYYSRVLRLLATHRFLSNAAYEKMVSDAVNTILKEPDPKNDKGRQQKRLESLVEILFRGGRWEHGGFVNRKISDEKKRAWNEFRVKEGLHQWDDALKALELISSKFSADPAMVTRATWSKAYILRDRKGDFDGAIKAFRATGEPPRSLLEIAEAQKRKKDHKAVIQTYLEVENSFPDYGAHAAMCRSDYYNRIGEKKKSIAEARRILKVYPKSSQSSWAHQHLESMGVEDTGGGIADEDSF